MSPHHAAPLAPPLPVWRYRYSGEAEVIAGVPPQTWRPGDEQEAEAPLNNALFELLREPTAAEIAAWAQYQDTYIDWLAEQTDPIDAEPVNSHADVPVNAATERDNSQASVPVDAAIEPPSTPPDAPAEPTT